MKPYNFEQEKKEHEIRGGKVKEEIHGDKKFLLKQALSYVVDAMDEKGSIEISHYEPLNYYEVCDFIPLSNDVETLDLTWLDKNDTFKFRFKENFRFVKKVSVNIDNLFTSNMLGTNNVKLEVNIGQNERNTINQLRYFKYFIKNENIKSIKLNGFDHLMTLMLIKYAEMLGIEVEKEDQKVL